MSINISPIDNSIPNRVIKTIIRGEFSRMQQEAEEGSRRLRTYLVATDLSDEAAYALEWTIGTVLRDGDTLLAVYAVDEESGTGKTGDSDSIHGVPVGEGAQTIHDTAALVGKLAATLQSPPPSLGPSPPGQTSLLPGANTHSRGVSTDSRYMSKPEQERYHAIEDISQTCIKFLRKTKLQVRIAVEVIHCKSPKYMITEAVRYYNAGASFHVCVLNPGRSMVSSPRWSSWALEVAVLSKGMSDPRTASSLSGSIVQSRLLTSTF